MTFLELSKDILGGLTLLSFVIALHYEWKIENHLLQTQKNDEPRLFSKFFDCETSDELLTTDGRQIKNKAKLGYKLFFVFLLAFILVSGFSKDALSHWF